MNWVGGARSRVRISEEKKKQKEFFQKRKLANTCNKLKPQLSSTVPFPSQDLLFFQTLDKCAKKSKPNTPPTVTKVDLGLHSKHRKTKSFDVELPLSPDYSPNVTENDKTSKRFTGCISSESAQKHGHKQSEVYDQENTAEKHSAHDKESAMKNWKQRWLKESSVPVYQNEKFKSHGCSENFLWNTKENHLKTVFSPAVVSNKISDSLNILPNENKANSQKLDKERHHSSILRGSVSNSVGRKEQISPIQKSDTSKYPSQNYSFNIVEMLLDPCPTPCSTEMPWIHGAVEQSIDKCAVTDVHKSKNSEKNSQWFSSPGSKGEFYSLQSNYYLEDCKADGNAAFMKLWDRSTFRNDYCEVKAVRERGTHTGEIPGKTNTLPQYSSTMNTPKSTARLQESSKKDHEKQTVAFNLEEGEDVLDKGSPSFHASKSSDNPSSQVTKDVAAEASINLSGIHESLLNENDQLKHMIPILIREFVSEFCERHHLLKNDLHKNTEDPSKLSVGNSSLHGETRDDNSTNADLSIEKADNAELSQWEVQEFDVCNTKTQSLTEDEDPMGAVVDYSFKSPKTSHSYAIPGHVRKTGKVNFNLGNQNQGNKNADSLTKNCFRVFSHKGLKHKTKMDLKKKFPEDCCEPELKDVSRGSKNEKCGQFMHPKKCVKTNNCTVVGAKKQTCLCNKPARIDTATQTVVPVKHSACQVAQSTTDTAIQTHINKNTQTHSDRNVQTHTDKSNQTHAGQSIQAHVNIGVQTHSDKFVQTASKIICDIPRSFLKKEHD